MPLFLSVRTKSNGQMCVCVCVCHISIFQRRNGSTGKYRQKHQVDETSITRTNIQFCWVRNAGKNETFLKKKKGMECTVTKRPLISEPSRDFPLSPPLQPRRRRPAAAATPGDWPRLARYHTDDFLLVNGMRAPQDSSSETIKKTNRKRSATSCFFVKESIGGLYQTTEQETIRPLLLEALNRVCDGSQGETSGIFDG